MSEVSTADFALTQEVPIVLPQDISVSEPTSTIDRLINVRTITKEHDADGRTTLAQQALELRKNAQQLSTEMRNTSQQVEQRSGNILVRLKDKLNIRDDKLVTLQEKLLRLQEQEGDLPDARKLIESYYENAKNTPLSNEEKRELLKPEVLAQLTTEEYIALWRRLNPYFLAHVTRQGFRDHNAMVYHTGGMQEYHDGFVGVMQDGKLIRPPFAVEGLTDRSEESVRKFMGNWIVEAPNEDEARKRFDNLLNWTLASAPKYPDKIAVHFTTQLVANEYYGGETGNEVVFAFPSDTIASQNHFAFNGWEKDFTRPQSETKWNDVFIWPNTVDNPGVAVDAGIVFLPENIQVDRETGSKYASEVREVEGVQKRVMVENTSIVGSYTEWASQLKNNDNLMDLIARYYDERDYRRQQSLRYQLNDLCRDELTKVGLDKDAIEMVLPKLTSALVLWRRDISLENALKALTESGSQWQRATNTISAREYWEKYFEQHPELRPKHIVYYDGDPTSAIHGFIRKNGIGKADTSDKEGDLLGFDNHHVTNMSEHPVSTSGYNELVEIGHRIIKDHFTTH